MRQLIVTQNITLDGVIDAAEAGSAHRETKSSTTRTSSRRCARKARPVMPCRRCVTFEQLRGYWPLQTDDSTGVRDQLNTVEKYVISQMLDDDPGWERSTVLRGPVLDEIQALKALPGKDIVATGSMTLMPDLIAGGMVDEYRLFTHPVVLGHGQRLFADASNVSPLRLDETRPFRSGIVLLRYRTSKEAPR